MTHVVGPEDVLEGLQGLLRVVLQHDLPFKPPFEKALAFGRCSSVVRADALARVPDGFETWPSAGSSQGCYTHKDARLHTAESVHR